MKNHGPTVKNQNNYFYMKYILGISILYKSYKDKKSSIRIRSNDHFIDEISLDEDIEMITKTISSYFYNKHMWNDKKYPLHTAMMKKMGKKWQALEVLFSIPQVLLY